MEIGQRSYLFSVPDIPRKMNGEVLESCLARVGVGELPLKHSVDVIKRSSQTGLVLLRNRKQEGYQFIVGVFYKQGLAFEGQSEL